MGRDVIGRLRPRAAESAGATGAPVEQQGDFELVSGVVEGARLVAFVDRAGTAVAVELVEASTVLTGVAAGVALSDLEESAIGLPSLRSRVSRDEADAMIETMSELRDGQKAMLRAALSI